MLTNTQSNTLTQLINRGELTLNEIRMWLDENISKRELDALIERGYIQFRAKWIEGEPQYGKANHYSITDAGIEGLLLGE